MSFCLRLRPRHRYHERFGFELTVHSNVLLVHANGVARLLHLGVLLADLLGPEELLGLERGLEQPVKDGPRGHDGVGDRDGAGKI
jgi:hypothetical protein